MAEITTIKDFKKAYKKAQRKKTVEKIVYDGAEWYRKNPEYATLILGAGATLLTVLTKGTINLGKETIRNANLRKEEALRDLTIWDPSERHRWQLRRKLTSEEWLEISEKRANGEKLSDILNAMKVLK